MRTLRRRCPDAAATRALGCEVARAARDAPGLLERGLVLALRGELGSGKTVFVQGVARGLGVAADLAVVSPTFTIARALPAGGGRWLHHLDAYRLAGVEDLEAAGYPDLEIPGALTCVEWAERVEAALPLDRLDAALETAAGVAFAPGPDGELAPAARLVVLRAGGPRSTACLRGLAAGEGAR